MAAGVAHLYCFNTLRMTNVGTCISLECESQILHLPSIDGETSAGEEFQALHSLRLADHFKVEIIRMVLNQCGHYQSRSEKLKTLRYEVKVKIVVNL